MGKNSFAILAATIGLMCSIRMGYAAVGDFIEYWGTDYFFSDVTAIAIAPDDPVNPLGSERVYVADEGSREIQVFDTSGTLLTKWNSDGSWDGLLNQPSDMDIDSAGNVYIADQNYPYVQVFDAAGNFLRKWGGGGTGPGQFSWVQGLAISSSDTVYVADTGNSRIQVFDSLGNFLFSFGSPGTGEGQFSLVGGIAISNSGNIYVSDSRNHRVQVFDSTGPFLFSWSLPGSPLPSGLHVSMGVAIDPAGNVYVADGYNGKFWVFDANGVLLREFGGSFIHSSKDMLTPDGKFSQYQSVRIGLDQAGTIYTVGDNSGDPRIKEPRVQIFDNSGNFIGKWATYGDAEGNFYRPFGIGMDDAGNLYITEKYNHRVQVLDSVGSFLRYQGTACSSTPCEGFYHQPYDVAPLDSSVAYVSHWQEPKIQIVDETGNYLGGFGSQWDPLPQAIAEPYGLLIHDNGNIYATDRGYHEVEIYDSLGNHLTTWGGWGSAEGQFMIPWGLTADEAGNVIVADSLNNRLQMFDELGNFIMQIGGAGAGDGQFISPRDMDFDGNGNLYVVDGGNSRVQVLDDSGAFLASFGIPGNWPGELNGPTGVNIGDDGTAYIVDYGNNKVQLFQGTSALGDSIDIVTNRRKKHVSATATITISDSFGKAVPGAAILGHWEGLTTDTDAGDTLADGTLTVVSDWVRKPEGSFCFVVDSVYKEKLLFDRLNSVLSNCVDYPPVLVCTDNDLDGYAVEGGDCGLADCDDTNQFINPGVLEDCFNQIDDDCNGLMDDADSACGGPVDCAIYTSKILCKGDPACKWNNKAGICEIR